MADDGDKPLIDANLLGPYDAIVVMHSKGKELSFVMLTDMSDEAFVGCCKRLRELVFDEVKIIDRGDINDTKYIAQFGPSLRDEKS